MKAAMSRLGLDMAKRVFPAVGMEERGKSVLRKRLARHDFMPFLAHLPRYPSAWPPVAARTPGQDASAHRATG